MKSYTFELEITMEGETEAEARDEVVAQILNTNGDGIIDDELGDLLELKSVEVKENVRLVKSLIGIDDEEESVICTFLEESE